MAKIPIIQAETALPVTARPEQAGRLWRAYRGLGREVQSLALTVAREEAQVRKEREALDMALNLSEYVADVQQSSEEMTVDLRQKDLDPEAYIASWNMGFAAITNERLLAIKDPETRARAKIEANRILIRETAEQRGYQLQLWKENTTERLLKLLDVHSRLGNMDAGLRLIEESKSALGADMAEKMRQNFKERVKVNQIRAENPEKVLKQLEAGRYDLDPDTRQKMMLEIRAEIGYRERIEAKRLKAERERVESDFFAKLMTDTLQPWEVVASELDLSTKNFFINAIEQRKEPRTDGPTFHGLFVGIEQGAVTPNDLLDAHNRGKLSKPDMGQLLTRLYAVRGGKQPESDWWFKIMRKEAEVMLDYDSSVSKFLYPVGAENFFYGITTLMKAVEDEGLRGRKVYERGREIFEPFVLDYREKVLGMTTEVVRFTDGRTTWEIPASEVEAFLKAHPKARRVTPTPTGP